MPTPTFKYQEEYLEQASSYMRKEFNYLIKTKSNNAKMKKARSLLLNAGIITKDGKLARKYR